MSFSANLRLSNNLDGATIAYVAISSRPVQGIRPLIHRKLAFPIAAAFALLLLLPVPGRASSLDLPYSDPEEILLAQRAISDTAAASAPIAESTAMPPRVALAAQESRKSAGKAFLMNLAVPGAGHLYAGHKRGFVHLGLEGIAWAAYIHYHDLGKTKEREYQTYADGHWDYNVWKSTEQANGTYDPGADSLILYFRDNNRQQYYEDIGKINTYWSGWDSQDNRNFYRGIRAHSNNFLKDAHHAVVGAFVNRIVSAVDILRVMKARSNALLGEDTHVRFKMRTKPFARDNAFGVEITKRL